MAEKTHVKKMNSVNPTNYKISIEPDLQSFNFSGRTEILIEAAEPVSEITLDSLDLDIRSCRVRTDSGFVNCPFRVNQDKEEMTITLPVEISGTIRLGIDYTGHINDSMAGLYRSRYKSKGETKYIAVTQFEESDARRAFPCFDHPFRKATFDIEMIIDNSLTAISNTPIAEERLSGTGKKLVRFEQTPEMSTYLVFFTVGDYKFLEDPGDVLVRVATLPGMTKYARFGLDFARKSLISCETKYGIKYPLPKLDLIAIPDFAFGAMENWGAITFRENLLLRYPDITSRAGEERICEIIAHEIVHQWFGNLVTPSDWKYLWLNESFATYFGYDIVGEYYPEWDTWDQFLKGQTDNALDRDALIETIPIEIPGGEHVVINSSTAPIIYDKGGSIMRQVKGYMGDESFTRGLRHYLTKHAYGCASSSDVWESFEEVSKMPVAGIMKSWIEQPGYPFIRVKKDRDRIVLTQERFTYLPSNSTQEWVVPITVRLFYKSGDSKSVTTLLETKQASIDIGPDVVAYKVNDRQTGFFRVRYEDTNDTHKLGELVLKKKLPAEDRWGLQNDLYAMVKGSRASIDDYLNFLANYAHEEEFLPLAGIADNLFDAYMIIQGPKKQKIAATGKALFERILAEIGQEPGQNEKHTMSILRDRIMLPAVLFGSTDVREFALFRFSSLMKGESIHPDIIKSIMQVGALNGDNKTFDWFNNRLNSSESEHERMNLLIALGSFSKTRLIEKALQYTLDKVPDRNKFVPIVSMAANPYAGPLMWDWYISQLSALEQFHPLHYERVIAGIIPMCGLEREKEVEAFFEDYMTRKDLARDVIKLSLERLKINSMMRKSVLAV
ncbi:MAG: M1 family metallopeptidase [Thermodesulfobacteriota bacterium]|nr:M1 family metallopeptidase [Thermodesulfobacteriota bacterium]